MNYNKKNKNISIFWSELSYFIHDHITTRDLKSHNLVYQVVAQTIVAIYGQSVGLRLLGSYNLMKYALRIMK